MPDRIPFYYTPELCCALVSNPETRVCVLSLVLFSLHALAQCPACSHDPMNWRMSFSSYPSLSLSPTLSLSHSTSLSLCHSAPYATVDTFTDSFFMIQRHINILPDVLLTSFLPPWTGLPRRHTAVSSCWAQGSLRPARRRPHPLVVADCSPAVA